MITALNFLFLKYENLALLRGRGAVCTLHPISNIHTLTLNVKVKWIVKKYNIENDFIKKLSRRTYRMRWQH